MFTKTEQLWIWGCCIMCTPKKTYFGRISRWLHEIWITHVLCIPPSHYLLHFKLHWQLSHSMMMKITFPNRFIPAKVSSSQRMWNYSMIQLQSICMQTHSFPQCLEKEGLICDVVQVLWRDLAQSDAEAEISCIASCQKRRFSSKLF